jgi:predicted secreted Zn-dependent protease
VAQLQRQVGNRAVQRIMEEKVPEEKKPPAADKDAKKAPVSVGQIKIERPKIEYYDVTGSSLAEVSKQLLKSDEWYEHEYDYDIKAKDGVVAEVDITVTTTIKLPRWQGPGWAQASDRDKVEWLRMLTAMEVDPNAKFEKDSGIPAMWLDPNWESVPETIKGEWRAMLQLMQRDEKGYPDTVRRHAMVFQQRLFGRPEGQVKSIADQFLKDLKVEREKYDRQIKFGENKKISLETSAMVQ